MLSASVIILQYICPGLGACLSNLMCLSPVRDVYRARKKGELGDINPTPWVFMFGQSLGWVAYGIVHNNLWLFSSDCLGLIVGIWLNLSAIKLLYKEQHSIKRKSRLTTVREDKEDDFLLEKLLSEDSDSDSDDDEEAYINETQRTVPIFDDVETGTLSTKKRNRSSVQTSKAPPAFSLRALKLALSCHETKFMIIATLWFICISIINLVPSINQEARETTVAMMASFQLVLYYCAPLSTICTVLSKRDSSSIHIPTMIANTVNASFWTAYGFAINDFSIIFPNGLGALFGVIQIVLCACIPRRNNTSFVKDVKIDVPSKCDDDDDDDNIVFPVKF
mmetsp:Transcript_6779/g.8451  ORF Transcript_6779/g.8451 Transcript_6779/m.8451 type:complete len:336 (+) Transcript_6779:587-1594(+)